MWAGEVGGVTNRLHIIVEGIIDYLGETSIMREVDYKSCIDVEMRQVILKLLHVLSADVTCHGFQLDDGATAVF